MCIRDRHGRDPHAEEPAGQERDPGTGGEARARDTPGYEGGRGGDAGPARGEQHEVHGAHAEHDRVADVPEEVEEQRVAVPVVDDPGAGLGQRFGDVDGQRGRPAAARPAGVGQRDEDRGDEGEQRELAEGGTFEDAGQGDPRGRSGDGGHQATSLLFPAPATTPCSAPAEPFCSVPATTPRSRS